MNQLKLIVVVMLLTVWLPVTSHELLEQVGWIHTTRADADNNHDAADGNYCVASNDVQVPQPELSSGTLLAETDFSLTLAALFNASTTLPNGPDPPGAAPPELSQTWQFLFRASLPPRAPSLIS